ncbi:MAG: hypothetical protein R2771_01605 [Saprospiraceae bacterium]
MIFQSEIKTIEELCKENSIDIDAFMLISNLYNGFYPSEKELNQLKDISTVLLYLKNSHRFYVNEKYPELKTI